MKMPDRFRAAGVVLGVIAGVLILFFIYIGLMIITAAVIIGVIITALLLRNKKFREIIMLKNVGSADRIIRMSAAVIIFVLIAFGALSDAAAVILGILAAILLITAFVGFCPAYYALKLNTRNDTNRNKGVTK
jgi:hypothetical protein